VPAPYLVLYWGLAPIIYSRYLYNLGFLGVGRGVPA